MHILKTQCIYSVLFLQFTKGRTHVTLFAKTDLLRHINDKDSFIEEVDNIAKLSDNK